MSDVVVMLTQIHVIDDFPYLEFKECVRSLVELYTLFIRYLRRIGSSISLLFVLECVL